MIPACNPEFDSPNDIADAMMDLNLADTGSIEVAGVPRIQVTDQAD
jgi:hypothetical protein